MYLTDSKKVERFLLRVFLALKLRIRMSRVLKNHNLLRRNPMKDMF
jgi:hypothetical protein